MSEFLPQGFKIATPVSWKSPTPKPSKEIRSIEEEAVVLSDRGCPALVEALAELMGKKLSDEQRGEWIQQSNPLLEYEEKEILNCMSWAVKESDYWSGWRLTMEKFVWKVEDILDDYRAAQRQKKIQEQKISGFKYSSTCLTLMAHHPDKTRSGIEEDETKARVGTQVLEFKKTCKECKGESQVKSKTVKIPVLCHACEVYRRSVWPAIQKQVHKELYA